MSSSDLIGCSHLSRLAVIYVRQSSMHQVLTNRESHQLQVAMREHARRLGWPDERIVVVETDAGISAQSTGGRGGYHQLLADVAAGKVGIVLSYESARLSRNCTDWYPLLDLCAYNRVLIADREGIYDPATTNGRLLLGMKGILSELELHTLRGRLLAGLENKARRGELALCLPAGLVRREDGQVVMDPNLEVQHAIRMIFERFGELKSAARVVDFFRCHQLRVPRNHRNREIRWRNATVAAVVGILRNPAYAGAFVYGKSRSVRKPGLVRPHQVPKRNRSEWKVIIQDRYPAYVSWESFEKIQSILEDNYAEYERNKSRDVPRPGAAILQGIAYCGACAHKLVVQYKGGNQYLCNTLRQQAREPVCQRLPADPIDACVVAAFFAALSPVQLDLYEQAVETRRQSEHQIDQAHQHRLQRLRYEVDLARRRYEKVDPDNRLVAGELERQWEEALRELTAAQQEIERHSEERDKIIPLKVPGTLREAFSSLGESLPARWQDDTLNQAQRKALLRCLIDKVVLERVRPDHVAVRIVWRGNLVTELGVSVNVGSITALSNHEEMVAQLLALESEGRSDAEIAQLLSELGFRSPMSDKMLESTVRILRLRHGRIHRFKGPRPRQVAGFLTVTQMARELRVDPQWLYHQIRRGKVIIERDPTTRLYLFPDRPDTIEAFRNLEAGLVDHLNF